MGREKKIKRTHSFDNALLARLEKAARTERRPVSVQLAIFLEEALAKYEREKSEPKPGPLVPAQPVEAVTA